MRVLYAQLSMLYTYLSLEKYTTTVDVSGIRCETMIERQMVVGMPIGHGLALEVSAQ